jgi:hypothetical protein
MAFQLSKELSRGIKANNCYVKILEIRFVRETFHLDRANETTKEVMIVNVAYYFDKAARDKNMNDYIEVKGYYVEDLTQDSRDKLYKILKTFDEFKNSTDV